MTYCTTVRHGIRVKAYYIHEAPTKSQYASCSFAVHCPEYLGKLELMLLWMEPSSRVHKGQIAVVQHVPVEQYLGGGLFYKATVMPVIMTKFKAGLRAGLGGGFGT